MKNIRPSSDLKNKYNEISALCKKTKKPVFITVNGKEDTVIIGIEEYNKMQTDLELLSVLLEVKDKIQDPIDEITNMLDL